MRTGKELILATTAFAKEQRAKSWYYSMTTLGLLLCLLPGALFFSNIVLQSICSFFYTLLLVRMFVIYHDYLHHSILQRSKFAKAIMTFFGIYILAPTSIWKRSHDYHHNHNSKLFSASIGSYPIATKAKYFSMSVGERRRYLFVRHPLTILFGYFFMFIIGMCLSSFFTNPRKHFDSIIAILLHIAGSACVVIFLGWQPWLFGVFIPFFVSSCIGAYLFYAQHNFPNVAFFCNQDWKYEVAALESSSYMVMNPFMQWMTGNIGYHHIHHLNSRIPFYRLPEVMTSIPELQKVKTTSLSVRDIYACLRLKVWDPDKNKMVGLAELNASRNS